jgi:Arc/MetJ-type ribon-helix-helix transcriptional regulator
MTAKEELHRLVDELADDQADLARQLLTDLKNAADEDGEPLSPETLESLDRGLADIEASRVKTLEDEKLIQKRLQSGLFGSVGEVIHDALASQDAEADWLAQNREAISEKIARGLAQLDRGEAVSGDAARARLERRKADWLGDRKLR